MEWGGGRTHLFLVVGNDAAHEVGVGVVECGHQLAQLLLVRLPHRVEHALARARTERRVARHRHTHANDLS